MGLDIGRFKRALSGVGRVGLDTPVLIYHLEDIPPYAEFTTHLFTEASAGQLQLVLSVVTLAEILVKPWQEGDAGRAGRIRTALEALPGMQFADITAAVAAEGASLRGRTGLPLPDALIVSSVVDQGARAIVTNDRKWSKKRLPCRALVLDDYTRN